MGVSFDPYKKGSSSPSSSLHTGGEECFLNVGSAGSKEKRKVVNYLWPIPCGRCIKPPLRKPRYDDDNKREAFTSIGLEILTKSIFLFEIWETNSGGSNPVSSNPMTGK